MQSYSYDTQIDNSGFLTIPVPEEFVGNHVNVIVTPLINDGRKITGLEFVERWSGLLNDDVTKETRIDYIESKHRC